MLRSGSARSHSERGGLLVCSFVNPRTRCRRAAPPYFLVAGCAVLFTFFVFHKIYFLSFSSNHDHPQS